MIDINFDPGHTIREGEELDFTLNFSGLPSGATDLTYDVEVVSIGLTDIPLCEGTGAGDDLALDSYAGTTTAKTGTIPNTCPHREYILVVTLKDGDEDLTRTASAFRVQEYMEWYLPGSQPSSPAGLWGEQYVSTVDGIEREVTRFHVVDSDTSQVYVYDLADRSNGESLTFVETYSLTGPTNPWGIAANASTTWVTNDGSGSTDEVFAYSNSDRSQRVSTDEFTLDQSNSAPRGIEHYSNSVSLGFIHVVDANADHVFRYIKRDGGAYVYDSDSPEDYDLHADNESPTGIFFDSYTMFVADDQDDKVYAYEYVAPGGLVDRPHLDVNDLYRVGNSDPAGVWADYSWVYVVDSVDKKIYAYEYPDRPFEPIQISGPSYISVEENSTTTGEIFTAMDPNPHHNPNATSSWALLGVHHALTDHLIFGLDKTEEGSSSTAEFELVFIEPANYEDPKDRNPQDNIYELLIKGSGRGFPNAHFPLTVEITNVLYEQPWFASSTATLEVAEATPSGRPIYPPIKAVHPDHDHHIYTVVGSDASAFDYDISTSTGVLFRTKEPLDYSSTSSYSVRVNVRDSEDSSGATSTAIDDWIDVTVNVFEGPVVSGPSNTNYPENGTDAVAEFSASNPGGDELEWSLEGDDAGAFTIASTTSGATLRFASTPDFENADDKDRDNEYQITVVAESGSLRGDLEVTVTVSDENDAPYFSEGPSTSRDISEGDLAGRSVGAPVTATDQDSSDTPTYSLSGTDASSFDINASTGQIETVDALDFEGKRTYEVTVEVSDGRDDSGNSDTATDDTTDVTINVLSVNEPPVLTGTTTVDYPENGRNPVATYNATDPEGHTPIIWGLSGTDGDSFTIASGVLNFDAILDYDDGQRSFSVTVEASDGNSTSTLDVTVNITDVNETPEVTGDAAPEFAENDTGVVATYDDGDPEGASITWSLAGDHADDMDIDSSGNLTFNNVPDHEAQDFYRVRVQAFDGNSTGTLAVVVTVTDVNEDPEFPSATTSRSVQENAGPNAEVGLPVKAEDPDDGDILTYILSGTGASSFTIDSVGQIRAISSLDSDMQATYEVTVEVHDGKAADGSVSTAIDDSIDVTITVTDVNEPPTLTGTTTVSIPENSGTTVATYSSDDPEGVTPVWDLSGDDADEFDILGGVLTFNSEPDHEAATDKDRNNVYLVTVEATDGNNTVTLNVTVTVTDVNEKPTFPSTETGQRSIEENTPSGRPIGAPVAATDPERDSLTYTLLSGNDADSFDINSSTGQILTKDALDSDTKATYNVTVAVHDGKNADGNASTTTDDTIGVAITVTDINEPPTVTGTTTTAYKENDTRSVETYLYDDQEGNPVTWSLSGADEDDFTISQFGELEFASSPDFETPTDSGTDNVYNVNVLAADGTSTTTYPVAVTVTDVNEDPAFPDSEDGARSVNENTPAGENIGSPIAASDPEHDALTYTLSSAGVEYFDIDEATGQLKTKADLDAEGQATYTFYVDVHDGKDADGHISTSSDAYILVTITVEDINEPPVVSGDDAPEVAENGSLAVATYSARW